MLRLLLATLFVSVVLSGAAKADWKPAETIKTYAVSGATGMQLYQSIGENGPLIGQGVRAIAHTTFTLFWKRDYQPRGTACVLASAKPSLTIIYTFPKPKGALSPALKAKWDVFMAGIAKHEAVHGANIEAMTREIERISVGLTQENDPGCKVIREVLQGKLKVISDARLAKESSFDQVEMSTGGNVQQLILALVNE